MLLWKSTESSATGRKEDEFAPYMELYLLPAEEKTRGAVVVFPGGGYCCRAPHEGKPVAEMFNKLGFHAFVVQYRTSPGYFFPAGLRDALRAIKLIRFNASRWGVNPNQIATAGFSAGGHLCASTATFFDRVNASGGDAADAVSARPDAVLPCYPVINITESWGHVDSGKNLLGSDYDAEKAMQNLESQVSEKCPPAFLWHTAVDGCVNVANSLRFAEAMWANGRLCELHVFPHGSHGLGLAAEHEDIRHWPELAARFLQVSCGFEAHAAGN